jgi:hypothetical protein
MRPSRGAASAQICAIIIVTARDSSAGNPENAEHNRAAASSRQKHRRPDRVASGDLGTEVVVHYGPNDPSNAMLDLLAFFGLALFFSGAFRSGTPGFSN